MDTKLPYHHRIAVQVHLLMCRYCTRFRNQLLLLRLMSHDIDGDQSNTEITDKLSEVSKKRIKKNLRASL